MIIYKKSFDYKQSGKGCFVTAQASDRQHLIGVVIVLKIVAFDNINGIHSSLKSGDVLKAVISKNTGDGYILNFNGTQIFARSQINFAPGELLTLRVIDISQTRLLLRLIHTDKSNLNTSKDSDIISELVNNPEAVICFMIASKLNLPITKERISVIREFLMEAIDQKPKESIHKSSIAKNCLQEKNREIKELKQWLLLKMLNILHKTTNDITNVFFFSPSQPFYNKVYAKYAQKNGTRESEPQLCLSFIIDTKNIGQVFVEILQNKNDTTVTMSFENCEALETVKGSISKLRETISSLVKSINLRVDNISRKNFFFEGLDQNPILTGIDVRL